MKKEVIGKIVADLKLKPELLNIWVEGSTDEAIIKNFLSKTGNSLFVAVRRIDFVEIDDTLLLKYGLNKSNNKHKVIAFAKEIQTEGPPDSRVLFIIDKDFDFLIGDVMKVNNLIYTDYSCMESYIFSEAHVVELFSLSSFSIRGSAEITFKCIRDIVHQLFAFRIEHQLENLCLGQVDYKTKCYFDADKFCFKLEQYVRERLSKDNKQSKFDALMNSILSRVQSFNYDERDLINGHDYEDVLYYYVFHSGNRHLKKEQFQGILRLLFADCHSLIKYPLFITINQFSN
jgi:hypothetical protein